MKAATLYRIASVLFVIFAAGHTFGFLLFKPSTAEGLAVRDAMNNVHFDANLSYGGFFIGFGLYVGVYLLFSAAVAWHLSRLAGRLPQAIGSLGWIFSQFNWQAWRYQQSTLRRRRRFYARWWQAV